jgi:hypothetical protein
MANAVEPQVAEDTGLSDATDTSTDGEESFDLEDTDISWEDGEKTDDAEEEPEVEAATDTEEEAVAEPEAEVDTEEEAPEEAEPEVTDTKSEDTAEAERKRHNDEMAQARIAEREARREAEAVKKAAEEANIERFLKEAEDDAELYRERQAEVREYRLNEKAIEINTRALQTDVQRATAEIDLFRTGTPAVRERLLRTLDQFEANNVVKDAKGRPVEVRGDVYQTLLEEADSIRSLLGDGAKQQTQDKTTQKSRTLPTPSRTPQKPKVDSDLQAFLDEAKTW